SQHSSMASMSSGQEFRGYQFRLGNNSGVDDQLDAVTSVSGRSRCSKKVHEKEMSVSPLSTRIERDILFYRSQLSVLIKKLSLPNIEWDANLCGFTSIINEESVEVNMLETFNDVFFCSKPDGSFKNVLDYILTESYDRVTLINSKAPLGNTCQGHIVMEWNYIIEDFESNSYEYISLNYRKADFF
ncbi:hypothetical protein BpHYR1_029905, partial [Brachionus plicatilis]